MSHARLITGDSLEVTRSLPDDSVDLVLTSPPFLALRSYLPADHPDKHREIGSEPDPAAFLDVLLDLTEEWRRVLASHGSIVVELGDTYAGSGGAGGDYSDGGLREGQEAFDGSGRRGRNRVADDPAKGRSGNGIPNLHGRIPGGGTGWPLPKSLCMIPQLYSASLAYGRNLLRPERLIEPWRVRNIVRWCRPNPPVGALGDKFRPATSEMTVACVSAKRYFDLDAVREPYAEITLKNKGKGQRTETADGPSSRGLSENFLTQAGAPPLDWWEISTEPYAGSHYATWPRKLLTRHILAMCPQRVCVTCGEPSRRITQALNGGPMGDHEPERGRNYPNPRPEAERIALVETLGWSDCGHDAWRPGLVLDPFAGSGTTLAVATGHGRDAIGIDIDERNADLTRERVGMFLTVEHFTKEAVA